MGISVEVTIRVVVNMTVHTNRSGRSKGPRKYTKFRQWLQPKKETTNRTGEQINTRLAMIIKKNATSVAWLTVQNFPLFACSNISKAVRPSRQSSGTSLTYNVDNHFPIILSVRCEWLQSLSTKTCTHYSCIYFILSRCYMFRLAAFLCELKTKQLKTHRTKFVLTRLSMWMYRLS